MAVTRIFSICYLLQVAVAYVLKKNHMKSIIRKGGINFIPVLKPILVAINNLVYKIIFRNFRLITITSAALIKLWNVSLPYISIMYVYVICTLDTNTLLCYTSCFCFWTAASLWKYMHCLSFLYTGFAWFGVNNQRQHNEGSSLQQCQ